MISLLRRSVILARGTVNTPGREFKKHGFMHPGIALCSSRKKPSPPHGGLLEIPRGRSSKKPKLEFLEGEGGCKTKIFRGGSMDIFWNYTFCF